MVKQWARRVVEGSAWGRGLLRWLPAAAIFASSSLALESSAFAIELLADVVPFPPIERRYARAAGLAAIAGLIILGFALVLLIWWGARYTRRYMNAPVAHHPTARPPAEDWTEPQRPVDPSKQSPPGKG